MNIRGRGHRSIRFKIVLIYCLLVFIATTIIGVFLVSQMEDYYINSVRTNMKNTVEEGTLIASVGSYEPFDLHKDEIQANISAWQKGISQEIFVVDDTFNIIAASNASRGMSAVDVLDCDIILQAMSGKTADSQSTLVAQITEIPVINMAFPIKAESGKIQGVLYIREDISSVRDSIRESQSIFVKGMGLAVIITFLLGFAISKSITGPINEVTKKAEKIAEGDFTQKITVKSDDEIGQLSEVFNYMQARLDDTMSELSGEKNKLEMILKHMADGLIAVDLSGKIIHANHAAMKMMSASSEDIQNENYDTLITILNPELTLEKVRQKCEMEPVSEIFEKTGRYYDVRYDRFQDENGNDIGIMMILQDITQRTKLENMQMDFVANVSHELKTPLTTIKSYTETLLDGAIDDRDMAMSFLGIVDTEADRMNRLVKDLLQLSRMENNQEKWNMQESNIINLLKSAVMKVELTAAAKRQQLNCLFNEEKRVPVVMDKDRVEQVVLNILSNAINYTQEEGRIDIDLVTADKEVRIIVTDNGIGIPEEEQPRIFERFFRVDKARSRSMGGTGLGLAISKQIVEEHSGRIELSSKEGKGTKMTIVLPLASPITRGTPNIE